MEWAVSALVLAAGLVFVFMVGMRKRWLFAPLLLAFLARLGMVVFHNYIYGLPQGGADALVFDRVARDWAMDGCLAAFQHLDPRGSYLYSGLLSVFYGCVGTSRTAAQLLNVVAGTISVAVLSMAAMRMWGRTAAIRCAWLLAVFPALLVYSAVTLREAFILTMFSCAIYAVVRFSEHWRANWIALAVLFLGLSATLHGGMAFGIVGLLAATAYYHLSTASGTARARLQKHVLVGLVMVVSGATLVIFLDRIFIPKVGNLGSLDTELVADMVASRAQGNAAYLTGLSVSSPFDVIWQAPIRVAYFLFSPFPWNVSSPSHLFGLFDAFLYLLITVQFVRYRKELMANPAVVLLIGILLALAFVYAYGTSNFGTAMRHRAKFYVAIVLVVAPVLLRKKRGRL